MRRIALLSVLLVAACAPGVDRRAYLNTLIGQSEPELVRIAGVPSRSYETGGHKFLAYTEQRQEVLGGGTFFLGGGFYGPRYGYGGGFFPADVIERVCETTFDLVGGRVASWSLRGNSCL